MASKKTHVKSNKKLNLVSYIRSISSSISSQVAIYKSRRPHTSFKRTRRRDYERSLRLPGYIAFTAEVFTLVKSHRWLFIKLSAVYALLGILLIGIASQSSYSELSELLDSEDWSSLSGGWLVVSQGAALLFLGLSGGINAQLTDIQQIYAVMLFLLTWLTTVWLLRSLLAGQKPKLRDGLYNAGAPIVSTAMITLVMLIQMIPAIAGVILLSSAYSSSLLDNSLISMLAGTGALLLCILSLYWAVATFFALVIVTLPGMYPWQAIRSAGDIVTGRRLRLLLRIIWMLLTNTIAVLVVVLIVVLIDRWIKGLIPAIEFIPIVPFSISVLSSMIVVWSATYIYILYRKVVEDDSSPA